jgi:flagellar basal body-associated protein FliL
MRQAKHQINREYDMDKTQKRNHQKKYLTKEGAATINKRALINILFAVAVIACACAIFFMISKRSKSSGNGGDGHAKEETETIVVTQAQQYQAAEDVYLEQKTGIAHLNISNDASNEVSIQVIIALKDGDILYTSDFLEPGTVLSEIQLDCNLEQGEYDIEISVDSYSADREMVGGVMYERTLFVE